MAKGSKNEAANTIAPIAQADASVPTDTIRPATNWNELLPRIFTDPRFQKSRTSRRRWQANINGTRVGIVVAWRPADYDNFALNKADIELLLKLKQEGTFDEVFVVLASADENFDSTYVGYCDAVEFYETLKSVPSRKGPHGNYWLIRGDFSLLGDVSERGW